MGEIVLTHKKATSDPEGGGRGFFTKFSVAEFSQHAKIKWTHSDVRFCENKGSKRSKINEKGDKLN